MLLADNFGTLIKLLKPTIDAAAFLPEEI